MYNPLRPPTQEEASKFAAGIQHEAPPYLGQVTENIKTISKATLQAAALTLGAPFGIAEDVTMLTANVLSTPYLVLAKLAKGMDKVRIGIYRTLTGQKGGGVAYAGA